jgi:BASS family bile acid:Na+ symporter
MNLATLIPLLLKVSIGLMVFGFGLHLNPRDLTLLFRKPGLILRSLLSVSFVMPLVAAALVTTFDLLPTVKVTMLALSLSPVPPLRPRVGLKAGGGASYIFSLLVTVAVLAVVVVPVGVELFGMAFGRPAQMSPVAIAQVVLISVLAPLAAGILVRRVASALAEPIAKPASLLAAVMLAAALIPILLTAMPAAIGLIGDGTLAAIVGFIVVGLAVGHLLGGPEPNDRTVLAIFTASRHPGVAMAIGIANAPGEKQVLATVLLYFIVNIIIAIPYMALRRRHTGIAGAAENSVNGRQKK